MANKQLTATVRLNTSQAERKLKQLEKTIHNLNKVASKHTTAYNQANAALNKASNSAAKVKTAIDQTTKNTKQWSSVLSGVNTKLNKSSSLFGMMSGKIKGLINTYLGVMGMGAIINTSDMITSAKNKLNYINGGNETLTQDSMDKMYASSQKVRMGYGDMMTNVAKSMTLAGDAFGNNTDNAIRFQEIMAEAYAVGGASAQEMSSSMYQMIQALGSGTLAGDELRSVREGAPLAYQAIEEFAQKVYDTTDSLKDLGSQGKITSDIVTAAILDAGGKMDDAFEQTEQTFTQTWTQIKNAAIRAFDPISEILNKKLNEVVKNGLLQKVETLFANIAKGIMITFELISRVIKWVADNWNWLKHVVVGAIITVITLLLIKAGIAIYCAYQEFKAWMIANKIIGKNIFKMLQLILVIAIVIIAILAILYVFYLWKTGAIDTCQAIVAAILIVGIAILLIGIITGNVAMIIIGIILVVLGVIFNFFEEIVGGAYGVANVFKAVCHNIGVFFNNLWHGASSAFWNFIGDTLTGIADLEPAFNAIAKLFGLEGVTLSGLTQDAYDKAATAKGKIKEYDSISDAWKTGYDKGYGVGENIKNKINEFGSKFQNKDGGGNILDKIGEKLGLDFSSLTFPTDGVDGSAYDPSKALGNIDDNTGKIADSMELTSEDVEYLRKIAALEWKKEYTVADIKVDMSNYNTINGESDLDGIITKLSDKLYEELSEVADGVYAY